MKKSKFYLAGQITEKQRAEIQSGGLAFFPELFGESNTKYTRFVVWMAENYKVVSPSTRDLFSAGGRGDLGLGGTMYHKVPRILIFTYDRRKGIINNILRASESTLKRWWGVDKIEADRLEQWITLVSEKCEIMGIRRILEGLVTLTLDELAKDAENKALQA